MDKLLEKYKLLKQTQKEIESLISYNHSKKESVIQNVPRKKKMSLRWLHKGTCTNSKGTDPSILYKLFERIEKGSLYFQLSNKSGITLICKLEKDSIRKK